MIVDVAAAKRWVAGVALLGLGLVPAPAHAETAVADVRFTLTDNRIFVPAMLNGRGPYQMLLDTGADTGGVSLAVMEEIGARAEGRLRAGGAGEGKDVVFKTHIGSLRIGRAEWRNLPAIAQTFGALNEVIGFERFDGIAGQAVFRRYVVDIDFARRHLRLIEPKSFRPPAGAIAIPFTYYEGFMPLVRGTIAGVRGRFVVDTGDRSSLTLFGPFWQAHQLDDKLGPGVEALTGYGVGGPIKGIVVRVPAFGFGKANAKGIVARLSLQKSGGFADPKIAGSIGTGVLKHFRTVIDYPHGRFLLVPLKAEPDRFDRAGLWLGRHGARFEAFDVIAGGPADIAGLRKGDIVTEIDRSKVETLDLFAIREKLRDPGYNEPVLIDYLRGGRAGQATLRLRDLLPGG
ncbi:MAG: aspartyl protease family protein [Rhizomicrobium sp.]